MNLEYFIAQKIRTGGYSGKKLAGPVIKVATLGIILGMTTMLLSIAIGTGFKQEIREKVVGFSAPIQVMNYDYNFSYETNPIWDDSLFKEEAKEIPGIRHIQRFATKPGLIKTTDNMQPIILKGVGREFDWRFLENVMVEGTKITADSIKTSNQIIVSRHLANLLHLKVNDKVPMYFIQDRIRARMFKVKGIFDSNLPEFDKLFAFVDIRQVQKLNNWEMNQISGLEILIDDFDQLQPLADEVHLQAAGHISEDGSLMRVRSIRQMQPQIFGWLDLLDMNIVVILILIALVAGFNMISGLLILILERTNMIGILKALGSNSRSLRKVFLYLALFIVGKGMLWGNLIGLSICFLQKQYGFIKLDPENYYLSTVPISLNLWWILALNLGTLLFTLIIMVGPSYLVSRITPVKAIRFD